MSDSNIGNIFVHLYSSICKSKRFSFNVIVYSSQLIVAQSIVVRDFKKSQFILGPLRPIHAKRLISLQEYSTGV